MPMLLKAIVSGSHYLDLTYENYDYCYGSGIATSSNEHHRESVASLLDSVLFYRSSRSINFSCKYNQAF
jgi:hypothetical protein